LKALPASFEQQIALLQERLKKGYHAARSRPARRAQAKLADLIPTGIRSQRPVAAVHGIPEDSGNASDPVDRAGQKDLFGHGRSGVSENARYVAATYASREHCRNSLHNGVSYAFHVLWQTTTDLTPQQIHESVSREGSGFARDGPGHRLRPHFKGVSTSSRNSLRTDARFYYRPTEDLVNGYRIMPRRIDPELAQRIREAATLPYRRLRDTEFKRLRRPQPTSERVHQRWQAGCYFVNTYNFARR